MATVDEQSKQQKKKKLSGIRTFFNNRVTSRQQKKMSRTTSMPVGLELISNDTTDGWNVISHAKRNSGIDSRDLLNIKPLFHRPQSEYLDFISEKSDFTIPHDRKMSDQSEDLQTNSVERSDDLSSLPSSSVADDDEWNNLSPSGYQFDLRKAYSDINLTNGYDNDFIHGNLIKTNTKQVYAREKIPLLTNRNRAPKLPSVDQNKSKYKQKNHKHPNAIRQKRYRKYKAPIPPTKANLNGVPNVQEITDKIDISKVVRSDSQTSLHRTRSFMRERRQSTMDKKRRLSAESKDIFENANLAENINQLKYLVELEIESVLLNKTYDQALCTMWCKEISTKVRDKVRHKTEKNYKVVANTYIGANCRSSEGEDSTHVSVQGITNPSTDKFLTVAFEGNNFFVWVTLCLFEY
ncbi:uncharacterized protein LOC130623688 [Hydractinia symbiolongicarpus]|uniref:uncharacterized protein LOC130623688 n=1 Tax=Hydractinia symbiolongicarpus TaxID=13093 RepID=UPI00254E7ED9|nr:uncharacterized protein LOC130623688 [Hydractinia symbiolongicarpus]